MIDLDTLKSQVSIGDILRSEGINVPDKNKYRIPCVIHHGEHSNMAVDENTGLYYCFVCGAGGSIIDLYASLNKISIKEAIDELSKDKNIIFNPLKIGVKPLLNRIERTSEVIKSPIEVPILNRLEDNYRGLSREAIDYFELARCEDGVFIPHFDLGGKRCSYSIRYPDNVRPKYKHNKGYEKDVPFGLFKNKQSIIEKGFVIIVEGQFDLISLWDQGFKNCIALCGSSLLESQAHLLLALTDNIILMLDGDDAGVKAMIKIVQQWQNTFNIIPAFLQNGMDPADWARSRRLDCSSSQIHL